jgi:hypothetical protein
MVRAKKSSAAATSLPYTRVQLAKGKKREAILDRMERLSGEMGTAFVRGEGRLVFEHG